jgi:hypothetical protein
MRTSISDRMSAMGGGQAVQEHEQPSGEGSKRTTLHDHGDGSYHTETEGGEKTEHPHIGHALMHMAGRHSEGKHVHAHQGEDGELTSHQTSGGGAEGPHDHENIEALKEHMGQFLDEEAGEGGHYQSPKAKRRESLFE